jgi:two-component system, NarL family, sensor kinase
MKKSIVIILFCLVQVCCLAPCLAQIRELDSLAVVLKNAKEDKNRIAPLKRIIFIWTDTDPDSAKRYISLLRSLGQKLGNAEAMIYADVKLAEIYNMHGDYAAAMKLNTANLQLASTSGTDYQQADVYKTIAMSFSMQQKNDSALGNYLHALKIYEKNNDSINMAKVMTNMAVVHDNMGDYKTAITYAERSKGIFKGKNRNAYLITLTNLALYQAYDKQYAIAETNYKEALQMASEDSNYNSLAHIYSGLTDVAYWQKNYSGMLPYATLFKKVATVIQNDYILLRANLNMGKALFFNKQFNDAESFFKEALRQSGQLEDNELLKELYGMYSYLLLKNGDLVAFDNYRRAIDSLTALQNKNAITHAAKELETQYETGKKDDQIRIQASTIREKQLLNYMLGGTLAALAIIGLISWRNYRQRQKTLEKEKQLTATRAVLQGQDEERSRLAKDLHDGLGGMLSGIKFSFTSMKENMILEPGNQQAFARSMDMLDGIIRELRRIAHNMMPESLIKFGLNTALKDMCNYVEQSATLKVSYQSIGLENASIDKNTAIHIYRIVQELLNNIMKHAKATEAVVQVSFSKGLFSITVEDNGSGFDTSILNKHDGMGWSSIQNRVRSLDGAMDVQSSVHKGTSVLIEFNIHA